MVRWQVSPNHADRDRVTVVKLSGGNQFPPFTFVSLGWAEVLPYIAPSVLEAQARRSHLMPVYGVIGQKVARADS
jgi:hypothetical protein